MCDTVRKRHRHGRVIDSPACQTEVVGLNVLATDLKSATTTPNLAYITPNVCDDGHDAPCKDGRPGD